MGSKIANKTIPVKAQKGACLMTSSEKQVKLEYPSIYTLSDELSNKYQNTYKRLSVATLLLIVLAALFDFLVNFSISLSFVTCGFVLASIFLMIIRSLRTDYKFWYDSRALAESIKTASWRFSMCAEPYPLQITPEAAKHEFAKEVCEMLSAEKSVYEKLDYRKSGTCAFETTPSMSEIRNLHWEDRKDIYIFQRINDQKDWYLKKSQSNGKTSTYFLITTIMLQIVTAAIALPIALGCFVNLSGFLLTLITSILTWTQIKQYSQLAHSYGVAAKELALIAGKFHDLANEQEFLNLVIQAELAMSREHTLWVSRNNY